MESLKAHLGGIRSPGPADKVYKDQCIYSFDTPECPTGLYVCLRSFLGVGRDRVAGFSERTGGRVFLHLRRVRREPPPAADDEPEKKVTRLAIGVEGGFSGDEKPAVYDDHQALVVLPGWEEVPLPAEDLPPLLRDAVAAVMAADSASRREELAQATGTWDGEVRVVSKHADSLQQLDNGVRVPPRGWQCAQCDKTDNLWLNLTDGTILCGRKFFDGSGGNNHAVEYYKLTGYPLAVKLGTISADGRADVFSYDEDDMVLDPNLGKHLAHFGINIQAMEKTDKSMVELEIEMNKKIGEWATIQEEGQDLKPLYGPGYTGLKNLGNSCYMNSAMQVMFTIPDFAKRYYDDAEAIFASLEPARVPDDFDAQMCKLAQGLLSGRYSQQPDDAVQAAKGQPGIEPFTFKNVVGRGHPEFAGKRQQDAQEFILHLINLVSRGSRHRDDPTDAFRFRVEERMECSGSHKVKYSERTDFFLSLQIPMEAATNKEAVREYEARKAAAAGAAGADLGPVVRARVPFEALLEAFREPRRVEQFYSTALDAKTVALQTVRLGTFPDFLLVQLQKFTVGDDWLPKKLDVAVPMPDELDLTALRGGGLQPGEQELPEPVGDSADTAAAPQLDQTVIAQLGEMGFPLEACRRAVYTTQNSGVEPAMAWIMEHMTDADFAAPFTVPGTRPAGGGGFKADPDSVALIVSMGFTPAQAERALRETNNSVERAADWIFSHQGELGEEPAPAGEKYRDGPGKYQLVAFISHMGTSTMVGHYVCHVLKEGRWCIFNDEKVAESRQPPRELAYLYLYRRCR